MKKYTLALTIAILFCCLYAAMSYPLFSRITTCIPGFFSSDESFGVLWDSWRIKHSFINGGSFFKTDYISYPFGIDFYSGQPVSYLWLLMKSIFAIAFTPALSYNLIVIVNFLLTAFFTYVLVFHASGNRSGALFSGIAMGFCPYMFVRSWQHIGETFHWATSLFLLSLFLLRDRKTFKVRLLVVLSLILTTINFNEIYYASVIFATLLFYLAIRWKKNKDYIFEILRTISFSLLFLIPEFFLIFKNVLQHKNNLPSAQNIYLRPFEDLFTQSARPLSYFLPSVAHPFFGKFTDSFVGTQLYGMSFTEHTLYLGWIPLILAFIAVKHWRRPKPKASTRPPQDEERFYIGFFGLLTLVAWLFSQPPWWQIGQFKIFMPPFFMYKILPMFRAYCRFGIVVMLAVAVLAGFGLKFLMERFHRRVARIAFSALLCGLLLFEFWNWPPFKVIDVSGFPAVYTWLKGMPQDSVIAEYPLDANGINEMYKFYQAWHEHKSINATIPGWYANKVARAMVSLSGPRTAGVLKWMGVRYVLVHKDGYLKTGLVEDIEEMNKIPGTPGLKPVKSFPAEECPDQNIRCIKETGPIDVYEVEAAPVKPTIEEK
jgi:hypothetical protein